MRFLTALAIGVLLAPAAPSARPIAESDLYAIQWVADPRISPDGSRVVFTRVTVNAKKDGYDTALWIVPADGSTPPRALTAGPRDNSPRWSPDGKSLAFLRTAAAGGRPQIHLLPLSGGEAYAVTDLPRGAGSPVWSPDGTQMAFTSTTLPEELGKPAAKPEDTSDVRVITTAVYRANGGGYREPGRPSHIWTVTLAAAGIGSQKPVTRGEFSESEPVWSRDGANLYFTSNRVKEPYYQSPDADLYRVPAAGGEPERIASVDGAIGSLALSPDGRRMAFVASVNRLGNAPQRSYSQADLWVTALEPGAAPRNLTADFDNDIAAGLSGDQAPPRGGSGRSDPFWAADGRSIFVAAGEEGRINLKRVDLESGRLSAVTDAAHDIYAYDAAGDRVVMAISTPVRAGELFLGATKPGPLRALTDLNAKLFAGLQLTPPEMIWYRSFDGRRIQAWVQRPPDFVEGRKYPLILNIHGGPHAAYGYTFDHEFQWMAAKGYVVLYPNPRGSTTYGQEFGNVIQYAYPGDDAKDLLAGVDELVKRGWADPDRLGVTGGSGGGILTNWIVTRDHRFKAAVSQRSIADWSAFWYTADFSQFTASWFRGAPWEQEADFKARSPITQVDKVKTPMMFIEGEADLRTPPAAGGEQMFRALKYRKIPTVMVQFPGESHELSRSGKPMHRVERLQHIIEWFEIYLKGQPSTAYDVR